MSNWRIFANSFISGGGWQSVLEGLGVTLRIAVFGVIIGFVLGSVLAAVKIWPTEMPWVKVIKALVNVHVALLRGTPMVVQLLLMHFAILPMIGLKLGSQLEATLIFGLNSSAYMVEIIRGGIGAVDPGQMEASRSLGLSYKESMLLVVLPQAIKNILPTLGNEFVTLIKETSVVSFIAVMDLTRSFKMIADSTYEYFVPYILLAGVYLVLVLGITALITKLERRFRVNER